jgi:hypothetical protein
MIREAYDLVVEPRDDVYRLLIEASRGPCTSFVLVLTKWGRLSESGAQVVDRLSQHAIDRTDSAEWPGTRLTRDVATILTFRLDDESASVLKTATNRLYGWRKPELPEDLCLVRRDGSPWLITISSEQDAYMHLDPAEKEILVSNIPSLSLTRTTLASDS